MLLRHVLEGFQKALGTKDAVWAVSFWRPVDRLVPGPPAPRVDRLEDERRLVSRIAELGVVVTTLDLVAIFLSTPAEAESEAMRVMLVDDVDVAITVDGVVL